MIIKEILFCFFIEAEKGGKEDGKMEATVIAELIFLILEGVALAVFLKDETTTKKELILTFLVYAIFTVISIAVSLEPYNSIYLLIILFLILARSVYKKRDVNAVLYAFMFILAIYLGIILVQFMAITSTGENYWDLRANMAGYSVILVLSGIMTIVFSFWFKCILRRFMINAVNLTWLLFLGCIIWGNLWQLESDILEPRSTAISDIEIFARILLPCCIFFLLSIYQPDQKEKNIGQQVVAQEKYLVQVQRLYSNYIQNIAKYGVGSEDSIRLGDETGNAIFDLILEEKRQEIHDKGIQIEVLGKFRFLNQIDSLDVVQIIDSMVEYLLEACFKSKNTEKLIKIEYTEEESCRILCTCPCESIFRKKNNMTDNQKVEMSIMQKVIHKYGGTVKTQNDRGRLLLLIKINQEK